MAQIVEFDNSRPACCCG